MSTFLDYLYMFLTALAWVGAVVVVGCALRFVFREIHRQTRLKLIKGDMRFFEIIARPERGDEQVPGPNAIVDAMRSIMPRPKDSLWGSFFGFEPRRDMTSIIVRSDPRDGRVHVYVGVCSDVSEGQLDSGLINYASACGYDVRPTTIKDIDPDWHHPRIVRRRVFKPYEMSRNLEKTSVGSVARAFAPLAAEKRSGTMIATFEVSPRKEVTDLGAHVVSEAKEAKGEETSFMASGAHEFGQSYESRSPSRGVVGFFGPQEDKKVSEALFKAFDAATTKMGVNMVSNKPHELHVKPVTIWGFVYTGLLALVAWGTDIVSWWVPGVTGAVCAAACTPWLSSSWVSRAARDGVLGIPPYWRISARRFVQSWKGDHSLVRRNLDEDESYIAPPSVQEVLPFYETSVAHMAALPYDAATQDVFVTQIVPSAPMHDVVNRDIDDYVQSGDVVFLGLSTGSYEPVYMTIDDINFGTAISGKPGSGKTNMLMNLFADMSRLSRKTTGRAKDTTITPIWLETKPDNVAELASLMQPWNPLVCAVHDPSAPTRLAIEGKRYVDGATPEEIDSRMRTLVSHMSGTIDGMLARSQDVARAGMTAAMLINEEELKKLGLYGYYRKDPLRPNFLALTKQLLGGGDASLGIEGRLQKLDADYSRENAHQLGKDMSDDPREARRKQIFKHCISTLVRIKGEDKGALGAFRNKIGKLEASAGMLEPYTPDGVLREEFGVDKFLTYGGPVIIDLTSEGTLVDDETRDTFMMLVHKILCEVGMSIKAGAGKERDFTPIFADEITNLTGRNSCPLPVASIIDDVKDKGRSFGLSHTVGFQNFAQLPSGTKGTLDGFESTVNMATSDSNDWANILSRVNDKRFSKEMLRTLPQGFGLALLRIGGKTRNACVLRSPEAAKWIKMMATIQEHNARAAEKGEPEIPYHRAVSEFARRGEVELMKAMETNYSS